MTNRILGLDYGTKRIGVAISDGLGLSAHPQDYIENTDDCFKKIKSIVEDYNIRTIVLGMPLTESGEKGPKALEVDDFSQTLSKQLSSDCSFIFWDERYSTKAVTRQLIQQDMSRKKRKEKVDSQAAAFILQGYLDQLASSGL